MELERVEVALSDECHIVVYESDWPKSRKRSRLESDAPEMKPDSSPLDYFTKNYYPLLASVSEGDVPSAEDALFMPREVLDLWYLSVWKVNPDWFNAEFDQEVKTKTVTLRDGTEVTVSETHNLPSFMMRLYELELDAVINPDPDAETQLFNLVFYPKMAAVTIGECPTRDDVRSWPMAEINKWYEAAREVEPGWFEALDGANEEAEKIRDKQEKKKERKKPAG